MDDQVSDPTHARAGGLLNTSLVPAGEGVWSGVLFDNPRIGLAPQLTWTFEFPFQDQIRDYGQSPVSLTLDWIPLVTTAARGSPPPGVLDGDPGHGWTTADR